MPLTGKRAELARIISENPQLVEPMYESLIEYINELQESNQESNTELLKECLKRHGL